MNSEVIHELNEFKEWVINKAKLSADLSNEFADVDNERDYAHGALGAYHDVRVELEQLIMGMESKL